MLSRHRPRHRPTLNLFCRKCAVAVKKLELLARLLLYPHDAVELN